LPKLLLVPEVLRQDEIQQTELFTAAGVDASFTDKQHADGYRGRLLNIKG
jgi:hypothetical protein